MEIRQEIAQNLELHVLSEENSEKADKVTPLQQPCRFRDTILQKKNGADELYSKIYIPGDVI